MKLYPINYKNRLWFKEDCNPTFVAYYTCVEALNINCSVYIGDNDYITPDGEIL